MEEISTTTERLKIFMADYDLTIEDVAKRINRDPKTVWQFLHERVTPHSRTLYRIRKLIGEVQ